MGKRIEAAKSGKSTYRGAWCPAGHPGLRYVSNGQCVECVRRGNKAMAVRIRELRAAVKRHRQESQSGAVE